MMNCYICGDEIKIIRTNLEQPPASVIAKILQPFLLSPVIRFLDKIDSEKNTFHQKTNEQITKCCNECLSKINEYDQTLQILQRIESNLQHLYFTKIKKKQQTEQLQIIKTEPNLIDIEIVETKNKFDNLLDLYSSVDENSEEEITNDDQIKKTTSNNLPTISLSSNNLNVVRVSATEVKNPIYSIRSIYQCSECKVKYTDKRKFQAHLMFHGRVNKQRKIFKCHICSVIFSRLDSLEKHLTSHAEFLKTVNAFDNSKKNSVSSKSLPTTSVQLSAKTFSYLECRICQTRFDTKMLVKIHMENEHKIFLPK